MFLLNVLNNNVAYFIFSLSPLFLFILPKFDFKLLFSRSFSKFSFNIFPKKVIFLFFGYYCCGGAVYNYLLNFSSSYNYFFTNIAYCLTILVLPFIIYFRRLEISSLYRPSLALLIAAFFWLPVYFAHPFSNIIFVIFQIGFAIFDFYSLSLILSFAIKEKNDLRVISFGYFIITISLFFGEALYFFIHNISQSYEIFNFASYAVGIMLLLFFVFVKADDYNPFLFFGQEIPPILSENALFKMDFDKSFAIFGLTPREKEIVKYILMGRNGRYIVDNLHISENTFKTHMRNIFRKCNISNRQELIDIIRKN
jgi:DNA-binding CsgD family transcriptional regulator